MFHYPFPSFVEKKIPFLQSASIPSLSLFGLSFQKKRKEKEKKLSTLFF